MNIAVCDDDQLSRKIITRCLQGFALEHPYYTLEISVFSHADDLMEAVTENGGFDIYLLDVLMPDTDGIELGVRLRKIDRKGKIIYLTSSSDYVFDAFKAEPYHYLIKPVTNENLFPVLVKASELIEEKNDNYVLVRTNGSKVKILFRDIIYAELFEHSVIYHLKNGSSVRSINIRTSFSEAIKELTSDKRFVQCGTSIAVNLNFISSVTEDTAVFSDGNSLILSKKAIGELKNAWDEFCRKEKNIQHSVF